MYAGWALEELDDYVRGMLVVTAAAVRLATRRDSIFVALLGLIGGFVTAYLLSSTRTTPGPSCVPAGAEHRDCLAGRSQEVVAAQRVERPPHRAYEWAWALQGMTVGLFPLAAGLFALFAVIGRSRSVWRSRPIVRPAIDGSPLRLRICRCCSRSTSRRNRTSSRSTNGPFGFLLFVDAGLLAIVWRGGPKWLHAVGGAATLITLLVWLRVSCARAVAMAAVGSCFIALYLVEITPFTGLLFGDLHRIAVREPQQWAIIIGAMLVILSIELVVTVRRGRPWQGDGARLPSPCPVSR